MTTMTKLYLILFLVAAGIGLCLLLGPERVVPENAAVTEYVFAEIRQGLPLSRVDERLGEPHETSWGEVVRVADTQSDGYSWRIRRISERSTPSTKYQGILFIYRGTNLEAIRVLAWDGVVIATEHCVDDVVACFKGPQKMDCPTAESYAGHASHNWWSNDYDPKWRRYQALLAYYRSHEKASRATSEDGAARPRTELLSESDSLAQ